MLGRNLITDKDMEKARMDRLGVGMSFPYCRCLRCLERGSWGILQGNITEVCEFLKGERNRNRK